MKRGLKTLSLIVLVFVGMVVLTGCKTKSVEVVSPSISNNSTGVLLKINTEGLGQVKYFVNEENKTEFNDEYPTQSAATKVEENTKVVVEAKPNEGWKFVKWTKDGKKYSTDSKVELTVKKDIELVAVFEVE